MKLLRDKEILSYVQGSKPIIVGLDQPRDWYDRSSPIQAASIDLHIGTIFIPGTKAEELGGEQNPKVEHVLKPGHTAVVCTLERLNLPSNLAAIGFPPSRVSFKGILMTNPGHVDPGYEGFMRFAVINMGSEDYPLLKNHSIVTLLIIELSQPSERSYAQRSSNSSNSTSHETSSIQDALNRLSIDFLDVNRRATKIADNALVKAPLYGVVASVIISGVFSLITNLMSTGWKEPISNLNADVKVLKDKANTSDLEDRVEELERQQTINQGQLPTNNQRGNP